MICQAPFEAIEKITGEKLSSKHKESFTRGADELDLVRSGLDDTMRSGYQQIREVLLSMDNVHDMRTAAYVSAINKISRSYLEVGVY